MEVAQAKVTLFGNTYLFTADMSPLMHTRQITKMLGFQRCLAQFIVYSQIPFPLQEFSQYISDDLKCVVLYYRVYLFMLTGFWKPFRYCYTPVPCVNRLHRFSHTTSSECFL